jgi:putative membrane protein
MKFILGLGKALTVAFWGVVLFNHFMPQPVPINLLIQAAGILLLSLHVLEVLCFNASLRGRSHRWFDRLQILLTGIFHVMSIRKPIEASSRA